MAMTWAELKEKIRNLGFEETDTISEYADIIRDASNRAQNFIYYSVEDRLKDYYAVEQSFGYEDDDGSWVIPKPKKITADTQDDDRINVADNVVELVPLLASHYVWLDDDITKATMYWNEYDQMKNEIMSNCLRPRKATIIGGIGW